MNEAHSNEAEAGLVVAADGDASAAGPAPSVSVIVPTHGRPRQLRACLEGIASSRQQERVEVIVVDDGGPTPLDETVAPFRAALDLRLIRRSVRGGPGPARNAGAAAARGSLLCFIDDDCVPTPGWLTALARQFRATPDRMLGGPIENALPSNPYATASQLITSYTYDYYERAPGSERFFTTNNLALGADAFRELGGFDTTIPSRTAEDKELCDRWRRSGRQLMLVPGAVVRHAHELTFVRFLRQHHNYGRGIYCFRVMRPPTAQRRLRPEPYPFYLNMLRYPLAHGISGRALLHAALIVVSQVATITGALRAALLDAKPRGAPRPGRAGTRV